MAVSTQGREQAAEPDPVVVPMRNGRARIEEASRPRIQLIPFEQIKYDEKRVQWSIKGITPREGIGVMWGASQSYKSFQELDQGMHIALGWPYRGRRVWQGPVVYCAFEGGTGFTKR